MNVSAVSAWSVWNLSDFNHALSVDTCVVTLYANDGTLGYLSNQLRIKMPGSSLRTAKLDIRLTPEAKRRLQAAATAAHRSVSEFVLDSALARAEETLADRTHFRLDTERWEAFLAALDAPPRDHPRLARMFCEPSVFETGEAP